MPASTTDSLPSKNPRRKINAPKRKSKSETSLSTGQTKHRPAQTKQGTSFSSIPEKAEEEEHVPIRMGNAMDVPHNDSSATFEEDQEEMSPLEDISPIKPIENGGFQQEIGGSEDRNEEKASSSSEPRKSSPSRSRELKSTDSELPKVSPRLGQDGASDSVPREDDLGQQEDSLQTPAKTFPSGGQEEDRPACLVFPTEDDEVLSPGSAGMLGRCSEQEVDMMGQAEDSKYPSSPRNGSDEAAAEEKPRVRPSRLRAVSHAIIRATTSSASRPSESLSRTFNRFRRKPQQDSELDSSTNDSTEGSDITSHSTRSTSRARMDMFLKRVQSSPALKLSRRFSTAPSGPHASLRRSLSKAGESYAEKQREKSADVIRSLLYHSCQQGDGLTIEKLNKEYPGCLTDPVDSSGYHCVHVLARFNQPALIEMVVALGAELDPCDHNNRERPVHSAAASGNKDVLRVLHSMGSDMAVLDSKGNNPIHHAAQHGCPKAITVLHEFGVDINAKNDDAETPAYLAAWKGHRRTLVCLADLGADLSLSTHSRTTPLWIAASNCHRKTVQVLHELGADVNCPDKSGRTPVYWAASQGNTSMIQKLADLGADLRQPNNAGTTPLQVASKHLKLVAVDRLRHLLGEVVDEE